MIKLNYNYITQICFEHNRFCIGSDKFRVVITLISKYGEESSIVSYMTIPEYDEIYIKFVNRQPITVTLGLE